MTKRRPGAGECGGTAERQAGRSSFDRLGLNGMGRVWPLVRGPGGVPSSPALLPLRREKGVGAPGCEGEPVATEGHGYNFRGVMADSRRPVVR